MIDTKHTPGPWEVSKDATPDYAPQYTVYDEASGNRVATAFQSEANAALIAAAPDMYEALRRIASLDLDTLNKFKTLNASDARGFAEIARATLAKAEGR